MSSLKNRYLALQEQLSLVSNKDVKPDVDLKALVDPLISKIDADSKLIEELQNEIAKQQSSLVSLGEQINLYEETIKTLKETSECICDSKEEPKVDSTKLNKDVIKEQTKDDSSFMMEETSEDSNEDIYESKQSIHISVLSTENNNKTDTIHENIESTSIPNNNMNKDNENMNNNDNNNENMNNNNNDNNNNSTINNNSTSSLPQYNATINVKQNVTSRYIDYSFRGVHFVILRSIIEKHKKSLLYTVLSEDPLPDGSYYINCASTYIDDLINWLDFMSFREKRYTEDELIYVASDWDYLRISLPERLGLILYTPSEYYGKQPFINVKVAGQVHRLSTDRMDELNIHGYLGGLRHSKQAPMEGDVFLSSKGTLLFMYIRQYINTGRIILREGTTFQEVMKEFLLFDITIPDSIMIENGYKPNTIEHFFPHSSLIEDKDIFYLRNWLHLNTSWVNVYNSTKDHKGPDFFHNHVDDQGQFLAVFNSFNVGVFGVYFSQGYFSAWPDGYRYDDEKSFIFTLEAKTGSTPKQYRYIPGKKNCIIYQRSQVITLGPDVHGSDLSIFLDYSTGHHGYSSLDGKKCYENKSGFGVQLFNSQPMNDQEIPHFEVDLVEAWIPV
ncbi:hypothetical protein WA158_005422 [Blastocystis sp. Blastoise]